MPRHTKQLCFFVGDQTLKEAIDTEICSKGHPGRPVRVALICCWLALQPWKKKIIAHSFPLNFQHCFLCLCFHFNDSSMTGTFLLTLYINFVLNCANNYNINGESPCIVTCFIVCCLFILRKSDLEDFL